MGAFFICNNKKLNIQPALDMFDEMGFTAPRMFEYGEWTIYAYSKMGTSYSNIVSDNDYTLIANGTPIYKGLNYTDSLKTILQDYQSEGIDTKRLIGHYTILICYGNSIKILSDPLGCKHLFIDKKHTIISSHMLPVCLSIESKLHINKCSFYEKFLTGIIMPPNTIFDEIVQIDKSTTECIASEGKGIEFLHATDFCFTKPEKKAFKKCLKEQSDTLHNYFETLTDAGRNGIDIGLSGGYDSRLVLACLYQFNKQKLHIHSHATENVHNSELTIAKQMANYVGVPCHTVATKKLSQCDNIDDVLRKSVLYFDGRSSFSIGGCGEVYTASYRKESTECTPFTLTGVGGELYRNVFDIGFRNIRFKRFMEDKVLSQNFRKAIPEILYREIRDSIISRAASRLGISQSKKLPKTVAHRYYCEIMMPDGQGVALDAYNQVSCCLAPFLEPEIIKKGYEAIPYHHSGGDFEGKLVRFIDSGLAAIPSSYGYPIGERPLRARIKERLRTYIPVSVWNKLAAVSKRKGSFCVESALNELFANSQTMKDAYTFMTGLFPEINFTYLLQSNEEIRMIQFTAMTLYLLKERIKVN